MKRTALTLTLIMALVFSTVAGAELFNWAEANPEPSLIKYYFVIVIESPAAKTYNTNKVQLNITASTFLSLPVSLEIKYNVDGGPFEVVYSGKGNFPVEVSPTRESSIWINLSDGSHTIIAKAEYENLVVCTNVTLNVDTVPPYLSSVLPENKTYPTSEIPLGFTVAGLSDIGFSLDRTARVSVAGNTSLNGVPDGAHSLILYGISEDGSIFASEPAYFAINTGTPLVSILSIENNTIYYTRNLNLTFYLSEPSREITFWLDTQAGIVILGNVTLTDLSYGSHKLVLHAEDSLDSSKGQDNVYFNIEEPFPTILTLALAIIMTAIGLGLLIYFKKRKH